MQVSPDQIPSGFRAGACGRSRLYVDSRYPPAKSSGCAGGTLHECAGIFHRQHLFARRRTSTGWMLTNSSYYAFGQRRFVLARVTRFGYMNAPLARTSTDTFRCRSASMRAARNRCADSRSTPPARATRSPAFPSAARRLREQHRTAPSQSAASLFRRCLWASCCFTTWATSSITRPTSGPAPSASSSRTARPARSWTKNYAVHDDPVLRARIPPAPAISTTFLTPWAWALRYHTPIGPLRFDFSYNLNPPIYPVIVTYGTDAQRSPNTAARGPGGTLQLLLQHRAGFLMKRTLALMTIFASLMLGLAGTPMPKQPPGRLSRQRNP